MEAKRSKKEIQETKAKRDIVAENIMKQGKKLRANSVKRIRATNNFVYEFNPFANTEPSNSLASQNRLSFTNSSDQKLLCARTGITAFSESTLNRNADFVKRKPFALPGLNSRINFVTDDSDANVTNPVRTCLPILSKENPTATLNKQLGDTYQRDDINREVENVKSTWRALRANKDWTRGKDYVINGHTRKLYEMLERMTCEIDKIQRKYVDPKANHYLHRSATNVFGAISRTSLKEDAEIIKSIIFPKKSTRVKSQAPSLKNMDTNTIDRNITRFDETTNNILMDKQPVECLISSKNTAKKRSIHTNTHRYNTDDDIESVYTITADISNKKRNIIADAVKPIFKDDGKTNTDSINIRSSIEEYLQIYNIDKLHDIEKKKTEESSQNIKQSASDIANILATLNIGSNGLYENFEKCDDTYDDMEESASEKDERCNYSSTCTDTTQIIRTNTNRENNKIDDTTSPKNTEWKNDIRSAETVNKKSSDTPRQAIVAKYEDNPFIKLRLDVLNKNLSKNELSQILHSEYLKKDLSI